MLTDAIIRSGKSRAEIARTLGIGRSFLSMLETGKKRPSLDLALRIARLTDGAVPVESWSTPVHPTCPLEKSRHAQPRV